MLLETIEIVEFITDLMYLFLLTVLFKKFFTPKLPSVVIFILIELYMVIGFPSLIESFLNKVPVFLLTTIMTFPLLLFYRGSLIAKMLLLSLIIANSILPELLLAFCLISFFEIQHSLTMFLIGRLFNPFLCYFIYQIVSLLFPLIKVFTPKMQVVFLCYFLGQYLIYISLEFHLLQYPLQNTYVISIVLNIILLILSTVMLIILHHSTKLKRKIKKLELENKLLDEMYCSIKKEEEKIIRLRHDIGNHLLTIDTLLKTNDVDNAKQYYTEVKRSYQNYASSVNR